MSSTVALSYLQDNDPETIRQAVVSLLKAAIKTESSNPLQALVQPGHTVVIKPNMVRHFNPAGSLDAVVTSPLVCRVLIEMAAQAVGPDGRVVVADSPQNDCDLDELLKNSGWTTQLDEARKSARCDVDVLDMRPERVVMRDGVIVSRERLRGDPLGEEIVDLGSNSAFFDSDIDPRKLRGSDYDPAVTKSSHSNGVHAYSMCRSFLTADVLIVVPKVKTHKKVGLSLAMKNLVGLVGEKNRLPHHTAGFPRNGGDEYPSPGAWPLVRHWATEKARPMLARGTGASFFRGLRRIEQRVMPEIVERSGNWWGNDTAWRMVVDLVSILRAKRKDVGKPTLFFYEGLTVGERAGPLAPDPWELGLLAATLDPVVGDCVVAAELGVDPEGIPLLGQARERRVWTTSTDDPEIIRLSAGAPNRPLRVHPGWVSAPPHH